MLTASCHCGAVRLEIPRIPRKLTQCNCSICRRYGSLWAYYRRKSVRIVSGRRILAVYSWGNGTLQFHHCIRCGCVTHHERTRKRRDGSDTLAVNMRNVDQPERIAHVPIRLLDGASTWRVLHERASPDLLHSPTPRRV